RRHTRSDRDWRSDVCRPSWRQGGAHGLGSENLQVQRLRLGGGGGSHVVIAGGVAALAAAEWLRGNAAAWAWAAGIAGLAAVALEIGRAACRESVWSCGGGAC